MHEAADAIETAYRFCSRISREAGSSFHAGFALLPKQKRRAMNALYAFMRHTDDLADTSGPVGQRAVALIQWRSALQEAILGREASGGMAPVDETGSAILPATADTVRRFGIPTEHLLAVIDGCEMDLTKNRYETFDDLREYCLRVASAVGFACIHIWGFHGDDSLQLARDCGVALQLTNILRDIKEDALRDRIYLPLADLRQWNYSIDDLKAGVTNRAFLDLMQFEIARAKDLYRSGAKLMETLAPDGRRIFGMMMTTYGHLLGKIERSPNNVMERRVVLGRAHKLAIAARWVFLPPRKANFV